MTSPVPLIVHTDGHVYRFHAVDADPAFLFDATRSAAPTPWSTGFVYLTAWLHPLRDDLPRLAQVRLLTDELRTVPGNQVCSSANLARFRLTPATALLRRTA